MFCYGFSYNVTHFIHSYSSCMYYSEGGMIHRGLRDVTAHLSQYKSFLQCSLFLQVDDLISDGLRFPDSRFAFLCSRSQGVMHYFLHFILLHNLFLNAVREK